MPSNLLLSSEAAIPTGLGLGPCSADFSDEEENKSTLLLREEPRCFLHCDKLLWLLLLGGNISESLSLLVGSLSSFEAGMERFVAELPPSFIFTEDSISIVVAVDCGWRRLKSAPLMFAVEES